MLKKQTLLITAVLLITFAPIFSSIIKSDEIADPNDLFYVASPTPNQRVKGTVPISWRMFDDEQQVIQYSIKLYDRATCKTNYYGDIVVSQNGSSNANTNNQTNWNTKVTSATNNLADGFYCLQVCAALYDGATPYSACNSREVIVTNDNSAPVINSRPPTDNVILESESWQY